MASADEESLSPKNRLNLLCSYGGMILPRPSYGQLEYVGGETRVLAVPRSISFSDLKMRIGEMVNNAEVVIKYQIMPEDLDAFVSVTCDDDLRHMLDEYDRQEPRSPSKSPHFRLFLFSAAPPQLSFLSDLAATLLEQRYVEAINGVLPAASTRSLFTISSCAANSPTPTIDLRDESPAARLNVLSAAGRAGEGLHGVHSTPNLGGTLCRMANRVFGNGVGPAHGCQQHHHHHRHRHRHRHHNHGQQGPPTYVGGVVSRMGSGSVWYEVCGWGCGCKWVAPLPHARGYHHPHAVAGPALGRGGCACFGHVDDPCALLRPRGGGLASRCSRSKTYSS